jgi:hypothetical protein
MKKIFTFLFAALLSVSMFGKTVTEDISINAENWSWGYNSQVVNDGDLLKVTLTGEWGAVSTGWDPSFDLSGWDKIVVVVENMSGCAGEWFKLKAYLRDNTESEPNQMEGQLGLDAEDNQQHYLVIDLHQDKACDLTKARILAVQCQPDGAIFKISKVYLEKEEEDGGEDVPTIPTTAPEVPTRAEADVMGIYCNHYATNNANFGISGWAGGYQTLDLDGTKAAYWEKMTWECIIDPVNTDGAHDFSAYPYVHVDMWAPKAAQIKFTAEAIAGGNYKDGVSLPLAQGWNSYDIEIAEWPGQYDFKNLKCLVLEQYQTPEGESFEQNPFAIANIYFWKKGTAVDNVTADTKAQKVIRDGQVMFIKNGKTYNALGAEIR